MFSRRDFHALGTSAIGALMGLVLGVPGLGYVLNPLLKRKLAKNEDEASPLLPLARLSDLKVESPRLFPIVQARQDAWVRYPAEPIGAVWLIRQKDDKVLALTAECPHLGCSVTLADGGKSFFCPCHSSSFNLDGQKTNSIPPRGMDSLVVQLSNDPDPAVRVNFQRFQTQVEEKKPLA